MYILDSMENYHQEYLNETSLNRFFSTLCYIRLGFVQLQHLKLWVNDPWKERRAEWRVLNYSSNMHMSTKHCTYFKGTGNNLLIINADLTFFSSLNYLNASFYSLTMEWKDALKNITLTLFMPDPMDNTKKDGITSAH